MINLDKDNMEDFYEIIRKVRIFIVFMLTVAITIFIRVVLSLAGINKFTIIDNAILMISVLVLCAVVVLCFGSIVEISVAEELIKFGTSVINEANNIINKAKEEEDDDNKE